MKSKRGEKATKKKAYKYLKKGNVINTVRNENSRKIMGQ